MMCGRRWDIHTRTQLISVGPALLLTLLLTGFFTHSRLQDLRQEIDHTGQLMANQLAPAAVHGVTNGDTQALENLLRATLQAPNVRFLEVRDQSENILVYVEQPRADTTSSVDVFHAPIRRAGETSATYLGRVVVGMSDETFTSRQQAILLKATMLALVALLLTFFLARQLARRLARPLSAMGRTLEAIKAGDYRPSLEETDSGELGDLARHINSLAVELERSGREQREAMQQLIQTREEAEQASRAKSDFLAMMSHELRTPMNGVLGMLQLLETTEMTQEQAEYAALATESTEHLLKVINDILDFSRIERGALELERIPFSLQDLLLGSIQVFQHSAQQRGLYLRLESQPGLEDFEVRGDPTRIRQILVNLLGNALKFTEDGGIRIETRWQPLDNEVLWFTCAVRDSGTGLGLSIARTLAERMGGTLHASSEEGIGSVFTLEIPLPFSLRSEDVQAQTQNDVASGGDQEVLLVEDNPVNQTVIEAMLRSLGYRVTLVGDGAQAVQRFDARRFSAVLMDCRLPVMDGYEATRQIRRHMPQNGTPIIALTANALQGDREACLQAGMNDYLAKPFKRADLERVLLRWLGKRSQENIPGSEK